VDILICRYNSSRSPMSTVSRNEVLLRSVVSGRHLVRRVPQAELPGLFDRVHFGEERISRTHGDTGRVIVRALYGEYSSPAFAERHDLVGRWVTYSAGEDIRQIEASLDDGTPLGILAVNPRWAGQPHGLITRKRIKDASAHDSLLRSADDAVLAYRTWTAERARAEKSAARELERLRLEQRELEGASAVPEGDDFPDHDLAITPHVVALPTDSRWAGDSLANALLRESDD
jgi:hypothetical protein